MNRGLNCSVSKLDLFIGKLQCDTPEREDIIAKDKYDALLMDVKNVIGRVGLEKTNPKPVGNDLEINIGEIVDVPGNIGHQYYIRLINGNIDTAFVGREEYGDYGSEMGYISLGRRESFQTDVNGLPVTPSSYDYVEGMRKAVVQFVKENRPKGLGIFGMCKFQ